MSHAVGEKIKKCYGFNLKMLLSWTLIINLLQLIKSCVGWCESRGDSHLGRPSPTLSVHRLRIVERLLDIEVSCFDSRWRTGGSDRSVVAHGGEAGESRWCCYPHEMVSQPNDVTVPAVDASVYKMSSYHLPLIAPLAASRVGTGPQKLQEGHLEWKTNLLLRK